LFGSLGWLGFGLWFCSYCLLVGIVSPLVGWWVLFALYCFVGGVFRLFGWLVCVLLFGWLVGV